jgi:D-alanyl-D-alanine carboxypeptidase
MIRFLLVGVLFTWVFVTFVQHPTAEEFEDPGVSVAEEPTLVVTLPTVVDVSARAYGVFDVETGKLLFGENVDETLPIASVSKLFTAAAVIEQYPGTTTVHITAEDVATEGRAGKLFVGEELPLRDLLFPLLLESSNDAAAAIERTIGAIPFADRVLADAAGLLDANQASIAELSSEASRLYKKMPHVFDITRLNQYVGEETGWVNNSPVHELPGYVGGKHGYTEAAGRTLVALFAEPTLNNRVLGYVVLGSEDIRTDAEILRAVVADSVVLQ